MNRRIIITALVVLGLIFAIVFVMFSRQADAPAPEQQENQQVSEDDRPAEFAPEPESSGFDKQQYSIDEPGSQWWVVSRERPLPDGYTPPSLGVPNVRLRLDSGAEQMKLSQTAIPAVEAMFADATSDGITLVFGSGYRSEALQAQFYNSYVASDGQEAADRYSARPGTSEHQTGLVFDVTSPSGQCHLEICFEDLPQGQWVAQNAHTHGFIIRYLEGKEDITGYQYEPWHLRYVGKELANELHENSQTMEEFFGL